MHLQWLRRSCLWLLSLLYLVAAYDPAPRWAPAVVLANDCLYVHGGKVDESNEFSYSSAPNTNQVLFLSLSSGFSAQSPPWALVNSSTASPSLAWHSISAFNTTHCLLFGGLPDPNSQTVLVNLADSVALFDVSSRTSPEWVPEPSSWAGQPIRRQRHSTSSTSGQVFIIGGERSDGSKLGFSDHFYFSGTTMTFHSLPTSNAPPDLYGHASVILSDGRILVFGGYSPSQSTLLPFSTIWVLDTSKMQWSVTTTDTSSLPSPRVAFAAAYIGSGKVIIQGGCDSTFQTNFADGWVLDTTKDPWTWSRVDSLTQVGPRRDHFAVSFGGQVIFGFGYSDNGPAPTALEVYSPSANTFVSTYTQPPRSSTTSKTVPSSHPTSSPSTSGSTSSSSPTPTTTIKNRNAAAIALGSIFGILALVAVGFGVAHFLRKRRNFDGERQFMALTDEDGDIVGETHRLARPIPIARMQNAPPQHGILGSLGVVLKMRSGRSTAPRRDMLADEDARSFGEWYNRQRSVGGSTWSLKSILGGGTRTRSRQPSGGSLSGSPLGEKDPFADQESIIRDERTGLISLTARTPSRLSRQETSDQSYQSESGYTDPFSDPIYDYARDFDSADLYQAHGHTAPSGRPPLLHLQSVLPVSQGGHPLSPLSEHTSQSTLPSQKITPSNSSQGHSSNDIPLTPLDSGLSSPSLAPRTTSIINTSTSSLGQPVRRTDSWWFKFSRANPLDRRSSGTSRKGTYEIRDPNPPPMLGAIDEGTSPQGLTPAAADEETPSQLPEPIAYPPGQRTKELGRSGPSKVIPTRVYGAGGHGKSLSSLKTADSEAIERMAGTMDVVHYRSQSGNRNSESGLSIETFSSASVSEHDDRNRGPPDPDNLILFASPVEVEESISAAFRHPRSEEGDGDPALHRAPTIESKQTMTPTSPGTIVDKVRQYERRMSMETPGSPTTPNTRQREERTKKRVEVNYGLALKPSLFVANPDRNASTES